MTLTYTDPNPDKDINTWKLIHFTDEPIVSLAENTGILFATTVSGIIWVSFDKGETWQLQNYLVKKATEDYQSKLRDIIKAYERNRADLADQYYDTMAKLRMVK